MISHNFDHLKNTSWAKVSEQKKLSRFSKFLIRAYRVNLLREKVLSMCRRLEGGDFFSATLRQIFNQYHNVKIGKYSYGCFKPNLLPSGTEIGNYCSIADQLCILRRNHPYQRVSQHPFFFNHNLGMVSVDTIEDNEDNPLIIGNDVWIGQRVTILPNCKKIGDGVIIGAGAVVTKNVEPFTVVAGNPARKICDRFSVEVKSEVLRSKWWNKNIVELLEKGFPVDVEMESEQISSVLKVSF